MARDDILILGYQKWMTTVFRWKMCSMTTELGWMIDWGRRPDFDDDWIPMNDGLGLGRQCEFMTTGFRRMIGPMDYRMDHRLARGRRLGPGFGF